MVTHAGGVYARVLSGAGEYAIYLDGDRPTEVTLQLAAGEYAVRWIDVAAGAVRDSRSFQHAGGERVLKSPEFRGGIAVRVSRK